MCIANYYSYTICTFAALTISKTLAGWLYSLDGIIACHKLTYFAKLSWFVTSCDLQVKVNGYIASYVYLYCNYLASCGPCEIIAIAIAIAIATYMELTINLPVYMHMH